MMLSDDFKFINLDYLNEISAGDDQLIAELVDMFFEQIPEYQDSMHELFEEKDWYNLGRMAHKAKSAVLMVGLNELANDLKNLEENAKEGKNINEYQEIIAKFVRESNVALKELLTLKK